MHSSIRLALLIGSGVLFVLAGLGVPEASKFKYIGWGLALFVASTISLD